MSQPSWVSSGWIAPHNLPASAPQPSTSNHIDTGDDRLLGATFRYGNIYTANTTGTVSPQLSSSPNAYANVQWYQITPTPPTTPSSPPTSAASSAAVTNSSMAFFFPGIQPCVPRPARRRRWFWSSARRAGSSQHRPASHRADR